MNSAHLVTIRNPFHPALGREARQVSVGGTLRDLVPRVGEIPFVVLVNGEAVLQRDWTQRVDRDDVVAVIYLPRGGKKGGSDPLSMVLTIAVAIFAPYVATFLFEEMVLTGVMGSLGLQIATATIGFVGTALVNAIAGDRGGTKDTTANQMAAMASPSPTYSLQAQGNVARLESAIPVQYGRLCCYPDFAALPYVEYQGNEQYLYQLLCLGAGDYDIEAIRIEDTPIGNFEEISTTIIRPGETLTTFPDDVQTSVEVGGLDINTQYATVGPFVANSAGSYAFKIGLDFVAPRGIYQVNTGTGGLVDWAIGWRIYIRAIDDNGNPLAGAAGLWIEQTPGYILAATNTPQRITYNFEPYWGTGRYEVKVSRDSAKTADSKFADDLMWTGLRAYIRSNRTYGDVTLLAMRMRATGTLSGQASRKVNVICTRKLPAWNGSTFGTPAATSSIAWALADMCRNATWGAGLSNARIDLAGLLALDATWIARGDEFNGRFDNTVTFWEALSKVARAGRAYPYMQGGIIRFSRDQYQAVPVGLFSMRNIVKGSFSVQYLTPHEVMSDAIDVGYFDETLWQTRRVRAALPGSAQTKPVKIQMFGITNRTAAYKEGLYEAACNKYRRKIIRFSTSMEGFIPSFGDLVAIAHDMPAWGQTAEVVGVESIDGSPLIDDWVLSGAGSLTAGAGPDGINLALAITDDNAAAWEFLYSNPVTVTPGASFTRFCFVKKDADTSSFALSRVLFDLAAGGGTTNYVDVNINTVTGESNAYAVGGGTFSYSVTAWDSNWWVIEVTAQAANGNDRLWQQLYPAAGTTPWTHAAATTGSATVWAGPVTRLTLSEPLTYQEGSPHYIGLRKRDGSVSGPHAATMGRTAYEVVVPGLLDFAPYLGQAEERTHIAFGWAETWRQPARVIEVRPRSINEVEIVCVNEDNAVHTADTGGSPPALQTSQLTTRWTAPEVTGFLAEGKADSPEVMFLSWQPSPGADHYYVEQSGDDGTTWQRVGEPTSNNFTCPVMFGENTWVRVSAIGLARGTWQTIDYGPIYVATLMLPPSAPTSFTAYIQSDRMWLSWGANAASDLAGYVVKSGGSDWATADDVETLTATNTSINPAWTGEKTIRIKAYDTNGNYSDESTVVATVAALGPPVTSAPVIDAENIALSWGPPTPITGNLTVAEYELRYGPSWGDITTVSLGRFTATAYRQKIDWVGTRNFLIAAYDVAGNIGTVASMPVTVVAPSAPASLAAEVIDNNVLLTWGAPPVVAGNLPVITYELRRGSITSSWETATAIGTKSGLFTSVFETLAGTYTYWVAAVDSRGNVGAARSVAAAVNQPPDYVLKETFASTFAGADTTFSNGIKDGDRALLLVNTAETFANHFINNGWNTPQAQIDAGHPIYLQPGTTSAYYQEIFDYGSVLAANKVTLAYAANIITGAAIIETTIETSSDKSTWSPASSASSIYATNFRYVRVRLTATASGGNDLVEITSLVIRLDSKLKTFTGMVDCLAADSGGTTVYLTDDKTFGGVKTFIDVEAITVTVAGTTPLIAVYDFSDVADPLSFKVLLFTTAGARSNGTASYTVRGF